MQYGVRFLPIWYVPVYCSRNICLHRHISKHYTWINISMKNQWLLLIFAITLTFWCFVSRTPIWYAVKFQKSVNNHKKCYKQVNKKMHCQIGYCDSMWNRKINVWARGNVKMCIHLIIFSGDWLKVYNMACWIWNSIQKMYMAQYPDKIFSMSTLLVLAEESALSYMEYLQLRLRCSYSRSCLR